MFPDKIMKTAGLALCFLLFSSASSAQVYGFRHYGAEYGIPDGFIYTINQSADGYLWIGTGNGLSKFDGYTFSKVFYPDSIETRNPYVSYKDSDGTIWFGFNDGSVFYTDGEDLTRLEIDNSRSISQILQSQDGLLHIVPQGGAIFSFSKSAREIKRISIPDEHIIFSATLGDDGEIFAGTQGNILIFSPVGDSLAIRNVIEGFDYSAVTALCRSGNYILAGTEDNGLFILDKDRLIPERIKGHPDFTTLNIRSIFTDTDNKIWISTYGTGVLRFIIDGDGNIGPVRRFNESAGMASDDVRTVFRDMENNYWFGMFGEGLSMLNTSAYGHYSPGKDDESNNIIFVDSFNDNYILGTPSGYHFFDADNGTSLSFNRITGYTGGATALSYYLDGSEKLWVGTNGRGLYTGTPGGSLSVFYRSFDTGSDEIRDIRIDDKYIWLATTNGVIVLDKNRGKELKVFGTNESLPHNYINKLFFDSDGVYIATESDRLYKIDKALKLSDEGCLMSGSSINNIMALCRDKNGVLWTATKGNGVFACYGDSVVVKNRLNGLFSNFCYSILSDSENNIWIGHEKGISILDSKTGILKSFRADYAGAGTSNPGAAFESAEGKVFIGTTSGVIIYNRQEDVTNDIPPFNIITSLIINDVEYGYEPVIRLPYSNYRLTINYSGINFSDPDKVWYSTYLENFDSEWSTLSPDRKVSYNIRDGKYVFHMISVDENGLSNDPGIEVAIEIDTPLFKKWWFIALLLVFAAVAIILVMRQRERAHRKIQEYLEDELEKRTSVIMKQKGEIELQNLEITDSINYAKRIQSSILPDISKLKENFREAFILFHPRDIVSGDFYWFDKIDEDKFIVVCADSTGHGVPGAFMSMIGSTLLQDIVTRKKITRPSQVLTLLDKQIFSTLNQNVDLGIANDGMDVVVCEFNTRTRHLRFASAMRPIIMVISGESYYIKGNRSSVGGESIIDKYFDDQEYYLNEGDSIYLFSDGFPDQFGGIDGKKMKIARLKQLIDQIMKLNMIEQERMIVKFFDDWRGGYEQIDDVLMLGIRV